MNDSKSDQSQTINQTSTRRRWLKVTGGAAVLLPVVHLTGCAEEAPKSAPAASQPAAVPKPAPAAAEVVEEAAEAAEMATKEVAEAAEAAAETVSTPAASGEMVKIEESDATAKALSYVHDASTVDKSKHPRFAAGQNCAGCAQYKANDADGWGGCAIFPGKLVADGGWCAGFIAAG